MVGCRLLQGSQNGGIFPSPVLVAFCLFVLDLLSWLLLELFFSLALTKRVSLLNKKWPISRWLLGLLRSLKEQKIELWKFYQIPWRVLGESLESHWRVIGESLKSPWRVLEESLKSLWRLSFKTWKRAVFHFWVSRLRSGDRQNLSNQAWFWDTEHIIG